MGHAWDFIRDYEAEPADLAPSELKHLAAVWQEQRERLETQDAFVRFNERLHREWAIETGLIERLYAFDRGVTQTADRAGHRCSGSSHTEMASSRSRLPP